MKFSFGCIFGSVSGRDNSTKIFATQGLGPSFKGRFLELLRAILSSCSVYFSSVISQDHGNINGSGKDQFLFQLPWKDAEVRACLGFHREITISWWLSLESNYWWLFLFVPEWRFMKCYSHWPTTSQAWPLWYRICSEVGMHLGPIIELRVMKIPPGVSALLLSVLEKACTETPHTSFGGYCISSVKLLDIFTWKEGVWSQENGRAWFSSLNLSAKPRTLYF